MSKKIWIIVPVIALILILAFVIKDNHKQGMIKIGYSPYSVNTPLFIAVEYNLFTKRGLNIELIPFQSTDQMAMALQSKQIDVATALTAESVYSRNKKSSIIRPFFLNIFLSNSIVDAIVVPDKSTISSLKNLEGKRVGILPADMMRVAFKSFLENNKVDPTSIEIIAVPPSSILSGMSSGDLDACYILEPLVTISLQKLNARIIAEGVGAKGITNPLPAGFHCVHADLIENSPGIGKKLIEIYEEAATKANNRELVVKVLQKYCSLDASIAQHVSLPSWSKWTPRLQNNLCEQFESLKGVYKWDSSNFTYTNFIKD